MIGSRLPRTSRGHVLINDGQLKQGLGLLDEAMVAVTAGELPPIVSGVVYCGVIKRGYGSLIYSANIEAAKPGMWWVHGHLAGAEEPHLFLELLDRLLARLTEDLDRRQRQELGEPIEAGPGHVHVAVERGRIGVDMDDGHPSAVLAEVHAVRSDLRLLALDEVSQIRDLAPQLFERSLANLRRVNVDERLGHLGHCTLKSAKPVSSISGTSGEKCLTRCISPPIRAYPR